MKKKNNDQGESLAAIFLWNEAHKLLTALDHMARKRSELFRVIARQTFYWPGFISHKRAFDRKNAELMEKIELGVDCPYSPKQWQISAPTTQLAMTFHLYCRTYETQWQLPPLTTKKNKRLWFERAWQYTTAKNHKKPPQPAMRENQTSEPTDDQYGPFTEEEYDTLVLRASKHGAREEETAIFLNWARKVKIKAALLDLIQRGDLEISGYNDDGTFVMKLPDNPRPRLP